MIKKIKVTNHLGESITFEIRSPEKSGFLVNKIDGLGPPKADINAMELATTDGALFNSARARSRNIVLDLGFYPNPTIEHTRHNSYKYFPIKQRILIEVESDLRISETYGYVETNDPNIFNNDEGTIISLICPDSFLYSKIQAVTIFSTIESLFEFPFSNESLTLPLLLMGEIIIDTQGNIVYTGDAPIGVTIYVNFLGSVTGLHISNDATQEILEINDTRLAAIVGSGFTSGDLLTISTVRGNKYVRLQRAGIIYNVFNALEPNSDWFELEKGNNIFIYTADTGITNLQFVIENRIAFEGA